MAYEQVKVSTGGALYEGWESVEVTWEIGDPVMRAIVTTTEFIDPPVGGQTDPLITFHDPHAKAIFDKWNFPPGTPVEIWAGKEVLMTGMVFVYAPDVSPDRHTVSLEIDTRSRHLVESCVQDSIGHYENLTDYDLVMKLAEGTGVDIRNFTPPDFVPTFQIQQGATIFAEAMRLFADSGKTLVGLPDGSVGILKGVPFVGDPTNTIGGHQDAPGIIIGGGQIVQGKNILKMSARLSAEQWADYQVIGQTPFGVSVENYQPMGNSSDPTSVPGRLKRILSQRALTPALAQLRADWENARAHGATTQLMVTVPGWRDGAGTLWWPNTDIYCYAPYMQINCWLRVEKCVFKQNISDGTVTEITLADPRKWGGKSAPCQSGPFWQWFTR